MIIKQTSKINIRPNKKETGYTDNLTHRKVVGLVEHDPHYSELLQSLSVSFMWP